MDLETKKMLEEMALRNAIAMFRDKNAKVKGRKAAIPEVGIFWVDSAGVMYAESVSLREAEEYGEFKVYEGSHYDAWGRAVRANPKWKGLEYEDVARGRVTYRKDPKKPEFVIFMAKQIVKYKGQVMARFNLPSDHVKVDTSDEHYRI